MMFRLASLVTLLSTSLAFRARPGGLFPLAKPIPVKDIVDSTTVAALQVRGGGGLDKETFVNLASVMLAGYSAYVLFFPTSMVTMNFKEEETEVNTTSMFVRSRCLVLTL
jgi:hypothetical protein